MRGLMVAALVMSLLGTATPAVPEECSSATGRRISVNGSSVVRLPPDRVSFSVGVETQAVSVAAAFRANNSKLSAVLTALKAKGVQAKEIQTSNLEIASRDAEGKKLAGFRVSNLVTVTREDPASVSDLLQAAVAAGANQAGSLRFFVSEPAKVQRRGLELAYQDAQTKAETLAGLAKRSLGEVACVSETGPWGGAGLENRSLAGLGYIQGPSVEIGTEQVSFGVSVVFELK
jgi:uncharacterized protein YggE